MQCHSTLLRAICCALLQGGTMHNHKTIISPPVLANGHQDNKNQSEIDGLAWRCFVQTSLINEKGVPVGLVKR